MPSIGDDVGCVIQASQQRGQVIDLDRAPASKETFLRVNNNNEKFTSDVFIWKYLKNVQDSCWYFRICANV